MRKRTVSRIAMLGLCAAVVLTLVSFAKQARFRGHTMNYWINQLGSSSIDEKIEARQTIRDAGTNAVDPLVWALSYEPSALRVKLTKVAEQLQRSGSRFGVPGWLTTGCRDRTAELAVEGFRELGATATSAIPALERLANPGLHPHASTRAVCGLQAIGSAALPALVRTASRPQWLNGDVIVAIALLKPNPHPVDDPNIGIAKRRDHFWVLLPSLYDFPAALPLITNALQHPKPEARRLCCDGHSTVWNRRVPGYPTSV